MRSFTTTESVVASGEQHEQRGRRLQLYIGKMTDRVREKPQPSRGSGSNGTAQIVLQATPSRTCSVSVTDEQPIHNEDDSDVESAEISSDWP
ncbi:hypothetical protein GUJ93_ZPchr0004g40286 [Zizania palustris]|uniref:Uncharacterized protein n=1 Tax=Zizania palustris TaxID=103762 RepID=A0A8J5T1J7_ZIZPA|nr:hypothetical protein GUJ93_ZPchr0004g40286 [Zizania palustris]